MILLIIFYYLLVFIGVIVFFNARANFKTNSGKNKPGRIRRLFSVFLFYFVSFFSGVNVAGEMSHELSVSEAIFFISSVFNIFLFVSFIWKFEGMKHD
ncbi:hypothetical protein AYY16_11040 [Morganella psychrotolerans]|nr:hypothetical protein AYY16_11040 [Morganella psychrotolerans]